MIIWADWKLSDVRCGWALYWDLFVGNAWGANYRIRYILFLQKSTVLGSQRNFQGLGFCNLSMISIRIRMKHVFRFRYAKKPDFLYSLFATNWSNLQQIMRSKCYADISKDMRIKNYSLMLEIQKNVKDD